jgi:hypothetical protein
MKNRFSKILGIVLAVTVMAGLLMMISPASPVSAGPLAWTNVNVPNMVNNQLIAGTVDTYVIAPDGKTIFSYDNTGNALYKSTDSGATFVSSGLGSGLNGYTVVALALTPTYATDLTVVAITNIPSAHVFRSTDGGATFLDLQIPPTSTGNLLTSVSVTNTYYSGGQAILVGYASNSSTPSGGVAVYANGAWNDLTTATTTTAPTINTNTTTLQAAATAGGVSLNVTSVTGFPAAPFSLFVGGTSPEVVSVSAVSGTILTVSALASAHASGDSVVTNISGFNTLKTTAAANSAVLELNSVTNGGANGVAFSASTKFAAIVGLGSTSPQNVNYTVYSPYLNVSPNTSAIHNAGEIVAIVADGAVASVNSAWLNFVVNNTTSVAGPFNVYAVAFSPTYTSDFGIIVVCSNTSHTYLRYKLSSGGWDASVLPALVDNNSSGASVPAASGLVADLAFPSDYGMFAPANIVYVSLGGTSANGLNVYRVNAASLGGTSTGYNLNVLGGSAFSAGSVAFLGPAATGTLVVGSAGTTTAMVYSTTNSYTSSPTWTSALTQPSGCGPVSLAFSPTSTTTTYTLYAGTMSSPNVGTTTPATHGGLFSSTDVLHFVGISLLNVSSKANVKISGYSLVAPKAWVFIRDWAGTTPSLGSNTMLFYSTDSGNTWVEIYSKVSSISPAVSGISSVPDIARGSLDGFDYPSQLLRSPSYATDNTMFLRFNVPQIWKSTDNGATWYGTSTPNGLIISTISLIDVNTYWVADAKGTGIYKSGYTTGVNLNGEIPNSISVRGTDMWATTYGNASGGSIWRSTDSGATFNVFGPANYFRNITGGQAAPGLSFDAGYATNKILYATSGNKVYRWVVDTNVTWDEITPAGGLLNPSAGLGVPINSITVSADGTMYINTTSANGASTYYPYYRNVMPTATLSEVTKVENWQNMPNTGFVGAVGAGPISLYNTSVQNAASNTIYATVGSFATTTSPFPTNGTVADSQNGYPRQILTLQDTLVQAPVIRAPAAKAQVQTPVTLSWTALPNVGGQSVTYQVKVATDAQFGGLIIGPGLGGNVEGTTPGTSYFIPANLLNPGMTYYWRVAASLPMNSKLSESNFSVVLAQGGDVLLTNGLFSPAIGATNVGQKPVFQWAAINGATSYNFQVADNPVFVNPVDSQTNLNTTVWTETKALDYGKVYYWRVQAVSAASVASDWANSSFTVMNQPVSGAPTSGQVVVPTYTFNIPTQPAATINVPSYPTPTVIVTVPQQTSTTSSTPASIWVLIAIGAVLIIAVIVLIARTRRV